MIISHLLFLRMRNVSDKSSRENQNTFFIQYFENLAIYEVRWKNLVDWTGHSMMHVYFMLDT
jgi:hypothetical protein